MPWNPVSDPQEEEGNMCQGSYMSWGTETQQEEDVKF